MTPDGQRTCTSDGNTMGAVKRFPGRAWGPGLRYATRRHTETVEQSERDAGKLRLGLGDW